MNVEFEIIKDIPVQQISKFESQTIKNVATLTRQETNTKRAFPYLSGELQRTELSGEPVNLNTLEYGLIAGVDYAKYVWKMEDVHWTNKKTKEKWYLTIYKNNKALITQQAIISALGSIK